MISVVIPSLNHERALFGTLASLVSAAAEGCVREAVVVDGGSSDGTAVVADAAGCTFIEGPSSRASRLSVGAGAAKGPWLLFLAPGAEPEEGWYREARQFIDRVERAGAQQRRAAVFSYASGDGFGSGLDAMARLRGFLVGRPLDEQGLLIHAGFYQALGGFRPMPAMEDWDLARRIGARRLVRLKARLFVHEESASREGELSGMRRALGLGLLALRVPPRLVARLCA